MQNVWKNLLLSCSLVYLTVAGLVIPVFAFADSPVGWDGKLGNGSKITESEVRQIIKLHEQWLDSNGLKGVRADFSNADLSSIDFEKIHPLEEDMVEGRLVGLNLAKANLSCVNLTRVNIQCVNFSEANLAHANLTEANLAGANLTKCNLAYANLYKTNLGGANLFNADLSYAKFIFTNVEDAMLTRSIMNYSMYESVASSPSVNHLGSIKGLNTLSFETNDGYYGLALLRTALKSAGLREEERQVTFSIEKGRLKYKNFFEKILHIVLFYWPCFYGESPLQPLELLAYFSILFAVVYYFPLRHETWNDGIYKIWPTERVRKNIGTDVPEKLVCGWCSAVGYAIWFSVLSASKIGWRDLNLGSWFVNAQHDEYLLKATGWIRVVSGIQSLISVYLLALCILTYFGRPFG